MKAKDYTLFFAWLIALIGTLGGFYMEYVLFAPPCHLCWYERICLYPLPIILGIACIHRTTSIVPYILPQVVIGLFLSSYQLIQSDRVIVTYTQEACSIAGICQEAIFKLGQIELPIALFSLSLFFLLLAFLLLSFVLSGRNLS